jgi:hypothetical protein
MVGLLDAINSGNVNVRELDDPSRLRRHVDELMMVRREHFDGFSMCAATAPAERIVGAAMMLDPTVRADGVGDTVIVGVNIASGTQIARTATRLREAGNDGVLIGIVLNALIPEWRRCTGEWSIPEVDALFVLDGPGSLSGFGELTQRCKRGVDLALR